MERLVRSLFDIVLYSGGASHSAAETEAWKCEACPPGGGMGAQSAMKACHIPCRTAAAVVPGSQRQVLTLHDVQESKHKVHRYKLAATVACV